MNFFSNRWAIVVLLVLAASTRFVGLSQPSVVVFDEVHFGKFVNSYCCSSKHFFDIHPPHAKLLIAGAGKLAGYDGSFSFENIGQEYSSKSSLFALRFLPALAGSLLPMIIFLLMRVLKVSLPLSFLAGLLLVFENSLIVQSRLISLDAILLAAIFGSITIYLYARQRTWPLALAGGLAGLAFGTKFTGLTGLGLIGLVLLAQLFFTKQRRVSHVLSRVIKQGLIVLGAFLVVYLSGWVVHNAILTQPGPGDAFYSSDASLYRKHQTMLSANYDLTATHPYSSYWYTWPTMIRPIFYWSGEDASIYFIGNPFVWWGAGAIFLLALSSLLFRKSRRSIPWLLLAGYFVAFVPLVRVPRALFLYHYLTALIFSLMIAIFWLDNTLSSDDKRRKLLQSAAIIVIIIFIVFSPLTYGFVSPEWWRDGLVWLPSWR